MAKRRTYKYPLKKDQQKPASPGPEDEAGLDSGAGASLSTRLGYVIGSPHRGSAGAEDVAESLGLEQRDFSAGRLVSNIRLPAPLGVALAAETVAAAQRDRLQRERAAAAQTSGNKQRTTTLKHAYAERLSQTEPLTGLTFAELIAEALTRQAMMGDVMSAKELRAATEGSQLTVRTWQNEIIDMLRSGALSPADVVEELGVADAVPLILTAGLQWEVVRTEPMPLLAASGDAAAAADDDISFRPSERRDGEGDGAGTAAARLPGEK